MTAGALTAAFVGVMGFLHTPAGRPLMARLGMSCPASRATPAQTEALRMRGLVALRGTRPAPARPARGWTLDETGPAQVDAWARQHGLSCQSKERPQRAITCRNVDAALLAQGHDSGGNTVNGDGDGVRDAAGGGERLDEITFAFAPDGRLVSVETFRAAMNGARAAAVLAQISQGLASTLGTPGELVGNASSAYLESGTLHCARLRYRYSDYVATVTAMNMSGRIALRELYQSATGKASGAS